MHECLVQGHRTKTDMGLYIVLFFLQVNLFLLKRQIHRERYREKVFPSAASLPKLAAITRVELI